jgi:translation initiation factor 3 subunit H
LTNAFYDLFKGKPKSSMTSTAITTANLMDEGLLQELPVAIRNYYLVSAMLYGVNVTPHSLAAPMPGVDRDQYTSKQANCLLDTLDDFGQEQARYAGWSRVYQREKARIESICNRKKHESPEEAEALFAQLSAKLPNEPPKLDSLLLSNQIAQHCKQLETFLPPAVFSVEMARAAASEKKI